MEESSTPETDTNNNYAKETELIAAAAKIAGTSIDEILNKSKEAESSINNNRVHLEKIKNDAEGLYNAAKLHTENIEKSENESYSHLDGIKAANLSVEEIKKQLQNTQREIEDIFNSADGRSKEIDRVAEIMSERIKTVESLLANLQQENDKVQSFLDKNFGATRIKVDETNEELSKVLDDVKRFLSLARADQETTASLKEEAQRLGNTLDDFFRTATKRAKDIEELYNEYFEDLHYNGSTKAAEVKELYSKVKEDAEFIENARSRTTDFETSIYGTDAKPGLKNRLEEFEKGINKSKIGWEGSYTALYNKIEGLLPGATSAGLARAYEEQKASYTRPYYFWSALFCFTTVGMIWYAVKYLTPNVQATNLSWVDILIKLLERVPYFVPVVWLAVFASKQQSQFRRLEEEYAHKASVAKVYEGHKREIESLPAGKEKDALTLKLLESMVDNLKNNPSNSLKDSSHNDQPPFFTSILAAVTKKQTDPEKN